MSIWGLVSYSRAPRQFSEGALAPPPSPPEHLPCFARKGSNGEPSASQPRPRLVGPVGRRVQLHGEHL